jgi:hypothetical protein
MFRGDDDRSSTKKVAVTQLISFGFHPLRSKFLVHVFLKRLQKELEPQISADERGLNIRK